MLRARRAARWLPALIVAMVVAALAAIPQVTASAGPPPEVAPKSVESVVTDLLLDQDRSLQGTIRATANLGLPDLPSSSLGTAGTVTALLTGTHTLRYWQLGTSRQRLAILDTLAETDLVRVASSVASYDSRQNAATRITFPRVDGRAGGPDRIRAALTALVVPGPVTAVHLGAPVRVAGRAAYTLDLVPRQPETLVDHVQIAVDARVGTALRIRVYAKGYASPALEATFTSVSYAAPPARLFDLVGRLPAAPALPDPATEPGGTRSGLGPGITTTGTGWATVLHVPLGRLTPGIAKQLTPLTEPVPAGRVLRTRLLTVLLTHDELLVGAVPADVLAAAAGTPP